MDSKSSGEIFGGSSPPTSIIIGFSSVPINIKIKVSVIF